MTRLIVGRLGLDIPQDNVEAVTNDGTNLTISGLVSYFGGEDFDAICSQIRELKRGDFYPVQVSSAPEVDGIYTLTATTVEIGRGRKSAGWVPFSLSFERASNDRSSLIEARILGALRTNSQGKALCIGWQAVPSNAIAYGGPASMIAPELRNTADGPIKVYTAAASDLLNTTTSWKASPENFMDGAARVKVGKADFLESDRFRYVSNATQSYVVPAGCTRLRVDLRGAGGGGRYPMYRGYGNRLVCELAVTAGETLTLYCGRQGRQGTAGGGWPNGGDGGGAAFTSGFGGGGRSEIRRGATTLVIAGGGGGAGGHGDVYKLRQYRAGHGGMFGEDGHTPKLSGKRGTWTAGGAGGVLIEVSSSSGAAGGSKSGGDGGAGSVFGGGGGGDGYYGGGGGAGCWQFRTGGAAGGGSSQGTGVNEMQQTGYNAGDGEIIITPILDSVVPSWLYTSTGEGTQGSNYAWEIRNGIIAISPVYRADAFQLLVRTWNGSTWSTGNTYQLTDVAGVTTTPATAYLTSMSIIKNNPEVCVIKCTLETGGKASNVSVLITLRRGAVLADVRVDSVVDTAWGWGVVGANIATSIAGGGLVQTTADAFGNKFFMTTPHTATQGLNPTCGWFRSAVSNYLTVGVGSYPSGIAPSASTLLSQWYAETSETLRVVQS